MKKICRNCHFLAKEEFVAAKRVTYSVSRDEREEARRGNVNFVEGRCSLKCYFGVWDEGLSQGTEQRLNYVNEVARGNECFFYPYNPNMLFGAAKELQRREQENKELRWTRKNNIIIAICMAITAIAAAVSVGLTIYNYIQLEKQKRPFFMVLDVSKAEKITEQEFRLLVRLGNKGSTLADHVSASLYVIDTDLNPTSESVYEWEHPNPVPPEVRLTFMKDGLSFDSTVGPLYLLLDLYYIDAISGAEYHQIYYLRWKGIKDGVIEPKFLNIPKEERGKVQDYLKERHRLVIP